MPLPADPEPGRLTAVAAASIRSFTPRAERVGTKRSEPEHSPRGYDVVRFRLRDARLRQRAAATSPSEPGAGTSLVKPPPGAVQLGLLQDNGPQHAAHLLRPNWTGLRYALLSVGFASLGSMDDVLPEGPRCPPVEVAGPVVDLTSSALKFKKCRVIDGLGFRSLETALGLGDQRSAVN